MSTKKANSATEPPHSPARPLPRSYSVSTTHRIGFAHSEGEFCVLRKVQKITKTRKEKKRKLVNRNIKKGKEPKRKDSFGA